MSSFNKNSSTSCSDDDGSEQLRRGPWTLDEDSLLIHFVASHGEGRWNSLAKTAGLRRTGKSCRLRWLNYLKPDVKRGNLTPKEQFIILELHSKWGNRWSKIAQHLPGRTDNEIKNYWRTRVQKQARHLKIDANSTAFQNVIRCFWMPRLLQKMDLETDNSSQINSAVPKTLQQASASDDQHQPLTTVLQQAPVQNNSDTENSAASSCVSSVSESTNNISKLYEFAEHQTSPFSTTIVGNMNDYNNNTLAKDCYDMETAISMAASSSVFVGGFEFQNPTIGDCCNMSENNWGIDGFADHGLWSMGMGELWEPKNLN